ncbi:response regulator [Aetokthonos hydrillicola Thurmond2011]|uniref:histidine kinase n=1 Tax=Aetokthonos hydrillicola Thurmond2011 TaxID=2712845 RepID=A0AAP5M660_9CYAN|nr:response regulator [Aetokthonos hydrillicola]MBO3457515.1 response regulator [Aetokthonos hydrillicola CCALA 1050]MBW4585963.1 response regulator [Aetokthonos hydrillicola CCALA 1050]MDR9893810.1 response regulator [Aetokthonos hydrillicola Thurmond2011]
MEQNNSSQKELYQNNYLEGKETILVIDDNQFNLDFLFFILETSNYQVLLEKDSTQGIERVKNEKVDLILLDVIMPRIDGFEVCEILKSDPATQDIPIIFMTALTDQGQKVKGLRLGAVDYITKPFQQEEILARIQVHIKMRRLNLELDQQKQQLEQRVQERTAELYQALEELKKTQLQLIQSEKISSLGQLVTGVAHEVNNPLGFISSNLHYAHRYIQDLSNLVKLYQKQFPEPGDDINKEIETIDLEHVLQDLPKLISSMKIGTDRIQGIMQSLRKFSRADGDNKKAIDIHHGLETTLMILQHRLNAQRQRPAIKVVKDYGNLPLVKCYPGQLNQVFMNLLGNAIDGLEESFIENKEHIKSLQITISTTVDNEKVTIRIRDNGIGIPESQQSHIFEPFFTNKSDSKGTGLGLSISYQIITQNHGGNLQCLSSLGQGTEFVIQIPINTVG